MSKSVNRLLDVLELFVHRDGGLSLTEISQSTGLNPATCSRYLAALVQRGYVVESPKKGLYHLGLKSLDFSYATRRNLKFIDLAYLPLSKLSNEINCDVYLTVLDGNTSLVVEEIGYTADMRINSPIGRRMALHSTACGKVHLASMAFEQRQAMYASGQLEKFTRNTITAPERLEEELEIIRRDGVAYSLEEQRLGVCAVAAPIYTGTSQIAAAGIMVTVSHMEQQDLGNYALKIINYTGQISRILARVY